MSELLTGGSGGGIDGVNAGAETAFGSIRSIIGQKYPIVPWDMHGSGVNSWEAISYGTDVYGIRHYWLNPLNTNERIDLQAQATTVSNNTRVVLTIQVIVRNAATNAVISNDTQYFYPSETTDQSMVAERGTIEVMPVFTGSSIRLVVLRIMGGTRLSDRRVFAIEQINYDLATKTFNVSSAGNTLANYNTKYPKQFLCTAAGYGGDYTVPNETVDSGTATGISYPSKTIFNPEKNCLCFYFYVPSYRRVFSVEWYHETETAIVVHDNIIHQQGGTPSLGVSSTLADFFVTDNGLAFTWSKQDLTVLYDIVGSKTYRWRDPANVLSITASSYSTFLDITVNGIYLNYGGLPVDPLMSTINNPGTSASGAYLRKAQAYVDFFKMVDEAYLA